jgi:hypothetical protein
LKIKPHREELGFQGEPPLVLVPAEGLLERRVGIAYRPVAPLSAAHFSHGHILRSIS